MMEQRRALFESHTARTLELHGKMLYPAAVTTTNFTSPWIDRGNISHQVVIIRSTIIEREKADWSNAGYCKESPPLTYHPFRPLSPLKSPPSPFSLIHSTISRPYMIVSKPLFITVDYRRKLWGRSIVKGGSCRMRQRKQEETRLCSSCGASAFRDFSNDRLPDRRLSRR